MARGGSRKGDSVAAIIDLSPDEEREWENKLFEFFRTNRPDKFPDDDDALKSFIKSKIAKGKEGWGRGPVDFFARIKRLTYFGETAEQIKNRSDKFAKSKRNRVFKETTKKKAKKIIGNVANCTIEDALAEKEIAWWEERKQRYEEEFEFNQSSDNVLLEKLLVEELLLRRLSLLQLANPSDINTSKLATEGLKRVQDLQVKLGITREQRADEIGNKSGDISTFALILDEKMKEIGKIEAEEKKEEEYYQKLKDQKPPINILPPKEKIIATLGIQEDGVIKAIDENMDISKAIEKIHYDNMVEAEEKPKSNIGEHETEDSS